MSKPGRVVGSVIPAIVFPLLVSAGIQLIFVRLFQSGTAAKLGAQCNGTDALLPYKLSYTGSHSVDEQICGFVAFFQVLLADPEALPFLAWFLAVAAPIAGIFYMESTRDQRSIVLALPVVVGLLSQVFTIGIVAPLYFMVFVMSGTASLQNQRKAGDGKITQGQAEALVFGLLVGSVVPSIAMIMMQDPYVTAVWQLYPIWVSIASFVHRLVRKPQQSGHATVQAVLVVFFMVASSAHIAVLEPRFGDTAALKNFFMPSIAILDPASTSLCAGALDFLKWDALLSLSSAMLATLWFAKNATQLCILILWHIVATVTLSPGAAVCGAFIWRESRLSAITDRNVSKEE